MSLKLVLPSKYLPKEGETNIYIHKNHEYCIVNLKGEIYAIDNICPHQTASLGLGDIEGEEIICPLHQYRFNIKTGKCNIEQYFVKRYEIQLID